MPAAPTESNIVPTANPRQRIMLVTGMSGAGKSTALQVLEDIGWETIDNFPVRLLPGLLDQPDEAHGPLAIGVDSRTRGFVPDDVIANMKALAERGDLVLTTLFIDCSGEELERRYDETRRPHPLAQRSDAKDGIKAERELLEPLRRWAEAVIDTTKYSTNDLQQAIRGRFGDSSLQPITIMVSSFGFARGTPPLSDLVFDMRFLDNPHWIEGLRELTGRDAAVGDHIKTDATFAPAIAQICDLLLLLLPRYAAQGKAYVNIAFGCTGGRHRSVYSAETVAAALREAGYTLTIRHRNLGSRAADEIERPQR